MTTEDASSNGKSAIEKVKNFKELLGVFAVAISITLGAVAYQEGLLNPQTSRVVVIVTAILFLAGMLWFVYILSEGVKRWQSLALMILYLASVGLFFMAGGWLWGRIGQANSETANVIKRVHLNRQLEGWSNPRQWDVDWMTAKPVENTPATFFDQWNPTYDFPLNPGGWANYTIDSLEAIQADVITADLFLPQRADIVSNFVELKVFSNSDVELASVRGQLQPGQRRKLILDLRNLYAQNSQALAEQPLFTQLAFSFQSNQTVQQDTLPMSGSVTWYRTAGEFRSSREQRGEKRELFSFEERRITGWQISSERQITDTIALSSDVAYRGRYSLALNTDLPVEQSDSPAIFAFQYTAVQYTLTDTQPRVGAVAHIFLPNNAPLIWAQIFLQSSATWDDGQAVNLIPGEWTTILWDMSDVEWPDGDVSLGIQFGAPSAPYNGSIYIDDVQLLRR